MDYEHKGFDEGRVPDCLARVGSPRAKARRHEFQELAIRTGGLRPSYQSGLDCVGADCHLSVVSGVVSDLRVLCRCRNCMTSCAVTNSPSAMRFWVSKSRLITCNSRAERSSVGRVLRAPERFLRQLRTLGGRALRSGDRLRCGLRWRWGRRLTAATLGVRLGARGASCSSAWRRLPWWGRGGDCGRSLFFGQLAAGPGRRRFALLQSTGARGCGPRCPRRCGLRRQPREPCRRLPYLRARPGRIVQQP